MLRGSLLIAAAIANAAPAAEPLGLRDTVIAAGVASPAHTCTLALPTGSAVGDLAIITYFNDGTSVNLSSITGSPSALKAWGTSEDIRSAVWYKMLDSADISRGSFVITTNSAGNAGCGTLGVYSNAGYPILVRQIGWGSGVKIEWGDEGLSSIPTDNAIFISQWIDDDLTTVNQYPGVCPLGRKFQQVGSSGSGGTAGVCAANPGFTLSVDPGDDFIWNSDDSQYGFLIRIPPKPVPGAGETQTVTNGTAGDKYGTGYGYRSGFHGSITDGTFDLAGGAAIAGLYAYIIGGGTTIYLQLSADVPNSGWTKMTIGGVDYNRSDAAFTAYNGAVTTWGWSAGSSPFPSSGTTVVTFS